MKRILFQLSNVFRIHIFKAVFYPGDLRTRSVPGSPPHDASARQGGSRPTSRCPLATWLSRRATFFGSPLGLSAPPVRCLKLARARKLA